MQSFQSAQRRHISDGLSLEMLCAVINNNLRCYNESQEFAEQLEETLAEHAKGKRGGGGGVAKVALLQPARCTCPCTALAPPTSPRCC